MTPRTAPHRDWEAKIPFRCRLALYDKEPSFDVHIICMLSTTFATSWNYETQKKTCAHRTSKV